MNKDTINKYLDELTNAGWLTRTKRSRTNQDGNVRHGYNYALSFPAVSDLVRQQDKASCPVSRGPVSEQVRIGVRTDRTYSPLNPHDSKSAQRVRGNGNLRDKLISAAKRSYERDSFEAEYPEVLPHLREIGGWSKLGQANEERELPRLVARIIHGVRAAA